MKCSTETILEPSIASGVSQAILANRQAAIAKMSLSDTYVDLAEINAKKAKQEQDRIEAKTMQVKEESLRKNDERVILNGPAIKPVPKEEYIDEGDECPHYSTNRTLANCRESWMTPNARIYLALLNGAMKTTGYSYTTDKRLAKWLNMTYDSWWNMDNKLKKVGAILVVGQGSHSTWRVVRPDLANNPDRAQATINKAKSCNVKFAYSIKRNPSVNGNVPSANG